jgi:hypothetical protein
MRTTIRRQRHTHSRHRGTLVLVLGLATAALIGRVALSPSDPGNSGSHTGATANKPGSVLSVPPNSAHGSGTQRTQSSSKKSNGHDIRASGHISPPYALPRVSLSSLSPPPLPSAAVDIAKAYAVATYSWTVGETFGQWIAAVTPLVTPSWLHRLASADPSSPSGSIAVTVLAIISAHGTLGELSAEVLVRLDPGGGRALLVALGPNGTGWAVDGAS